MSNIRTKRILLNHGIAAKIENGRVLAADAGNKWKDLTGLSENQVLGWLGIIPKVKR